MNAADPPHKDAPPRPVPELRITAQHTPDGGTLRVRGEIDLATAPALEAGICAYLGGRAAAVTVDLSAVTFIDCSGLNALLRSHARGVREGTTVRIGPVSVPVARFLALVCDLHLLPADLVQDHARPGPAPTSGYVVLSAA
ncbi:STAS domain-containing protein [Streptomyces sp. NBC_00827]|uniref:STAS domain-containing protein n=1 Tax=Streptomyces sp. NBC_00827 TaxID=2903677 RepID=UPI003867CDC6|nr:STAS domain-containing protein [Streptomyces sp. NBC_00827]